MTDCTFFDEEPYADGLPHWATITQVSTFLNVPRTTIRGTVRRAATSDESWVRKAMADDGTFRYLIDTTHESYQTHEQRWKQHQEIRAEEGMAASADRSRTKKLPVVPFQQEEYPVPPSPSLFVPFSWLNTAGGDDVLHRWPAFRQRLHSWGIQIFQNRLAEEGQENPWQWRWGDLHGEGYQSSELAILAALENRLMLNETPKEVSSATSSAQTAPMSLFAPEQGKSQGFTLFGRRQSAVQGSQRRSLLDREPPDGAR
ncbi:MAG TPA: hypothetical protein VFB60_26755 [Ktedonobacteraceae bacterium]|nr:hypothetical protein [Ktedonobacteraceae bacterium]